MALFTSAAVATFLGVSAGFFTAATAFALNTAVAIGASALLNVAAQAISGNKKAPEASQFDDFSVQGTLTTGGDVPRSFGLGHHVTSGSLVYANTYGSVDVSGADPDDPDFHARNRWLVQVIAVSDLPTSLVRMWVDGKLVTLTQNGPILQTGAVNYYVPEYLKLGPNADADDTIDPIYGDPFYHLYVTFFDGTQDAAAGGLVNVFSSDPDRPYGLDRVGKGIAYAIVTAHVNDRVFSGWPTFKFELSGIPLYDPSKDSTVGGSGTHVYSDPSTWGGDGDDLPAVQIYNILRGIRYDGDWVYGLQNMTAYGLPASSWIEQIEKCRATVTGEDGPEPTYRSGGQVDYGSQPANAIESIMAACQGKVSEIGGRYKINVGAPASASYFFTDDEVLSSAENTFKPFFALSDSVNGIQATYPNPDDVWNTATAPPYYRTDLEVRDGNRRLMANPSFDFVPYPEQVQRLQKSAIEEAQRARTHVLVLGPESYQVEPGDVVAWSSEKNGYEDKLFRVDVVVDRADLDVGLSITEVDPSDYDWDHGDFVPPEDTGVVIADPIPEPVGVSWVVEPYVVIDPDGVHRRPGIKVSWDPGIADVKGLQAEVRLAATEAAVTRKTFDRVIAGFGVITEGLLPETEYEVRGQFIPTWPREMEWTDWTDVTTPDARFTLADLEDAIDQQITIVQDQLNDRLNMVEQETSTLNSKIASLQWINTNKVRTELSVRAEGLAASIVSTQEVAIAGDSALASLITALTVRVDENTASIVETNEAFASADSALASSISSLTATVGGNTASIAVNASAISTLNGYAAARYSVTLDVNGYATGFVLINAGASVSTFTVTVDQFQVARPGFGGGAAVPVFTIGTVSGVSKIGFRGDMFIDGTINAISLNVSTLSAITADIGSVTAGTLSSADLDMLIDLDNKRIVIDDGL